ncbi:MAG: hypothetical protein LBM06_08935 [Prevotellaceae bacterium]|jgi:hypothetical protein|nr:hypothetical protein [Prevotellaceae bacterium]
MISPQSIFLQEEMQIFSLDEYANALDSIQMRIEEIVNRIESVQFYKIGIITSIIISLALCGVFILQYFRKKNFPTKLDETSEHIYALFQYMAESGKVPKENDWLKLRFEVDKEYNCFSTRLLKFHPSISPQNLRISLLLKLDFPPSRIAPMVCLSKQGICSARKRLYEKTHHKMGSAEDWDKFIRGF